jgi:YD repeat-containing protein
MRQSDLLSVGLAACVMAAAAPAAADVQYIYDSAGRLSRAIYSNGITIEYRYDAAGNRTQIVTTNVPNSSPVAVNDTGSVNTSASVNLMVLGNDSDPEGNSLIITSANILTGGGSVTIQGGATYLRYTAPATSGPKTLTYTISDQAGGSATATVTVTASLVNIPPVADDDSASAAAGTSQAIFVLGNDTDANGHTLTVTAYSSLTGGSVTIPSGGGHVIYTAPTTPGSYSFNYTVSDGHGGTDVGAVSVEVTSGEDPPCDPNSSEQCEI